MAEGARFERAGLIDLLCSGQVPSATRPPLYGADPEFRARDLLGFGQALYRLS